MVLSIVLLIASSAGAVDLEPRVAVSTPSLESPAAARAARRRLSEELGLPLSMSLDEPESLDFDGGAAKPRFELEPELPFLMEGDPLQDPKPARRFPLPEKLPWRVEAAWETAPNAFGMARNARTVMGLAARIEDEIDAALRSEHDLTRNVAATALRAAFAAGNWFLADTLSTFLHEHGHMARVWMAGGHPRWTEAEGGDYAFGRVVTMPDADWAKMTDAERLAYIHGGVNATQAATQLLRLGMLESDAIPHEHALFYLVNKIDFLGYALGSNLPSQKVPGDYANDMINQAELLADRTGRSADAIFKQTQRAAHWTMMDPTMLWAMYATVAGHVFQGRNSLNNPMPQVAGVQLWAATSAHLSDTGPFKSLHLLARDPESGRLFELTPSFGPDAQWGLKAEARNLKIADGLNARVGAEFWRQNEAAEALDKRIGGSLFGGIDVALYKSSALTLDFGYKTDGAMLGRDSADGGFLLIGAGASF